MTPSPSIPSPRHSDRGGVSWVTVLLLAVLVTVGYLAVVWLPVYAVHYGVKQTVRDYMNQAVKNKDDAGLVERMCHKLRTLDTMKVVGEDGVERTVPTVDVQPDAVSWERDTNSAPPMLRVRFEYTRPVRYPYLSEVPKEWTGTIDLENDLTLPDWGPAR